MAQKKTQTKVRTKTTTRTLVLLALGVVFVGAVAFGLAPRVRKLPQRAAPKQTTEQKQLEARFAYNCPDQYQEWKNGRPTWPNSPTSPCFKALPGSRTPVKPTTPLEKFGNCGIIENEAMRIARAEGMSATQRSLYTEHVATNFSGRSDRFTSATLIFTRYDWRTVYEKTKKMPILTAKVTWKSNPTGAAYYDGSFGSTSSVSSSQYSSLIRNARGC